VSSLFAVKEDNGKKLLIIKTTVMNITTYSLVLQNVTVAQYNYEKLHPKISVYKLVLYPRNQEQKLKQNCPAE
jgi:hypothetical protein